MTGMQEKYQQNNEQVIPFAHGVQNQNQNCNQHPMFILITTATKTAQSKNSGKIFEVLHTLASIFFNGHISLESWTRNLLGNRTGISEMVCNAKSGKGSSFGKSWYLCFAHIG